MNNLITNVLTEETPGKVMGLLGVAMFSLAFLFTTAVADADFGGANVSLSDPFSMESVSKAIDNTAASYSKFLAVNLIQPASEAVAIHIDNARWVADNSGLTYALGFETAEEAIASPQVGYVAGASTYNYEYAQPVEETNFGLLDALFAIVN